MSPNAPGKLRSTTPLRVAAAILVLTTAPSVSADSVQEQRARLPPPAVCSDPVEGTWMAQQYSAHHGDWYVFTLTIQRVSGHPEQLTGSIEAHFWTGHATDHDPPPCRPGELHWITRMTARGDADGHGQLRFGGTTWSRGPVFCGQPGGYNLDHFSGVIDASRQEFQSVNNDGDRYVNEPVVFRRVRCAAQEDRARITVAPPPFYPPRRTGGCF